MTWKSTAVVSGIGLLATWVASVPPPSIQKASAPPAPQVSERVASSASDIQRQAERLQVAVRADSAYEQPSRNLFRFGSPAVSKAPRPVAPQPTTEDRPVAPPPPAALQISLSGIAEDTVEGKEQRTAILSTPTGVLLVHEGDEVAGQYRVGAIESGAVELVRLDDGGVLRIALKP
jgi:hypothetical protein